MSLLCKKNRQPIFNKKADGLGWLVSGPYLDRNFSIDWTIFSINL